MNWPEARAWLYAAQQFGIKLGLENTFRLLEAAGNPHEACRFLHVAGTNGKGSVCAMLDAILRAAGFRTGLYTSPHLVDFRERIRVNGEMIPEAEAAKILTQLRVATETWPHAPTYFELATVLALRHFADAGAELVVLETGMGGRLDSTNAVTPLVSVLTPVAMDHAQWLGDSLEKIADEKAGILKAGVPAVSAAQEPAVGRVFMRRAGELETSLRFVQTPVPNDMEISLRGRHQRANAALALAALDAAGLEISAEQIARGLASVDWPGRFQVFDERFVLDGGHNPHAAAQLVATWRDAFGDEKAVIVFGALADKDFSAVLEILSGVAAEIWFVPVRSLRAASLEKMADACPAKHRVFENLAGALAASRRQPNRVLITGSLFLIGEALELLSAEPSNLSGAVGCPEDRGPRDQ